MARSRRRDGTLQPMDEQPHWTSRWRLPTLMMMPSDRATAAELASGMAAIVVGAGFAFVLQDWLSSCALPLLLGGVLACRGAMTLKHHLAIQFDPPHWWERLLSWLCWACLAGLSGWLAVCATD